MEAQRDELIECSFQVQVYGRDRDPRRNLHVMLPGEQRPDIRDDPVVRTSASFIGTQGIVGLLQAIEANGYSEPMGFEEIRVALRHQCSIGSDGKSHTRTTLLCNLHSALRGFMYHWAVDQWFAAQECEV